MSLERTPTRPISTLPGTSDTESVNVCSICNEILLEDQNCVIIQECKHIFHRICIESFLATSSQCPVCKRACQLAELQRYYFPSNNPHFSESPNPNSLEQIQSNVQHFKPSARGKPRGAKAYHPRSYSRSLFDEGQSSLNNTQEMSNNVNDSRSKNTNDQNQGRQNNQPAYKNARAYADYDHINRMIEESMARLLTSLNILPQPAPNLNTNQNRHIEENVRNSPGINPDNNPCNLVNPNRHNQVSSGHANVEANINPSNLSSTFRLPYTVDKISSIVQGWNLRFDGSQSGLNVDGFLYRLKSLTLDHFEGDFTVIGRNLQILLTGRARDWLWRYRKQVPTIQWDDFCRAIRS